MSKKRKAAVMTALFGCAIIAVSFVLQKSGFGKRDHYSNGVVIYYQSEDTEPKLYGLYDVVRVVDGDTIVVSIDGTDTKIRMIGVDTPESVDPDKSQNTAEGEIASQWTKDHLSEKQVYLEYDVQKTDKYGRTLAYVYLDDKTTMVQDELLRNGLAEVMTVLPNSKYAAHFEEIEKQARKNKVGFWSENTETKKD